MTKNIRTLMRLPVLSLAATCIGNVSSIAVAADSASAAPSVNFQNLRYDDSQATREASLYYTKLTLSDKSDLNIGGQIRERGEWWDNFNFKDANDDTFLLSRIRLNGDLHTCENFRLFVEGRSAFVNSRDLPTPDKSGKRPTDEDELDLENAFGDLSYGDDTRATLRLGRQELSYGAQRTVGVLDWANTRRTFDGAKAMLKGSDWQVDAFATRLVQIQRYQFNDGYTKGQDFYGIYATKQFKDAGANLDLYALNRLQHGAVTNAINNDDNRDTFGSRLYRVCGKSGFDYDIEGDYQSGTSTGDKNIDAWSIAAVLGYKAPDCPYNSRLYLEYDYATGDKDPKDGDNNRYNPLYPTGHLFFGLIDAIGRQNIEDFCAGISAAPVKKVTTRLEGHYFERAESKDGVYDAGGNLIVPAAASKSSNIGEEVDFTIAYQYDAHLQIAAGYGHFFAGDVVNDAKGDDINTAYLSGQYTF